MRILLTSNGLPADAPKVRAKFLELVGKLPTETKVAFIPTASVVEDDRTFMRIDRKELEEVGIPAANITDLELDHPVAFEEINKYDVVFVDGGNTFYLLEKIRQFGFAEALAEYLKQDRGVYVGVSAGTCIMGPDIDWVAPWDDKTKAPNLTSTVGLGYTKEAYSPHFQRKEKTLIDQLRSQVAFPILGLPDGEMVVVEL